MPDKNRKIISKALIISVILTVILTASAVTAFAAFNYYNKSINEPLDKSEDAMKKEVVIKSGSTSDSIIQTLYDEGLINNKTTVGIYIRLNKLAGKMMAGKYEFSTGMNASDIIDKMVRGEIKKDTVKVTIPEGYEIKDIAIVFEKAGLVERDEFIDVAQNGNFDYDFLKSLPKRQVRLEGYLFPDTYEFSKNVSAEQIIKRMLDRFDEVFNEEMRKKADDMNLTIDKVVTMASIVEREAKVSEERPIVSAVFYNRIKINKKLESCATVQYALGERKENLLYKDLEIDSPYNTYKHSGLPVGPIANPGKASLEAALNPSKVDYLYFVVKDINAGTHAFSTKYADFLKDKENYFKNVK